MAAVITRELDAIKKEYGSKRRTSVENAEEAVYEEKKMEETEVCFLMDRFGYMKLIDKNLVTVERARTIAADGTESVAETIKRASADSFSGLTKGWQEEAEKGVLGTFDTLVTAVKKQDWQSVGKWVLSTLYNGLAPETKQLIDDTGKALIRQVNGEKSRYKGCQ